MRTVTGPWGSFRTWDTNLVGHIISTGQFWDQQIQPYLDEADPSGWALDLGANIGWFTVYLAKRFAHVVAVEAHPGTCQLLRENVQLHGVQSKVTVIEGAAYSRGCRLYRAPGGYVGWAVPDDDSALDTLQQADALVFLPAPSALGPVADSGLAVRGMVIDRRLRGLHAHMGPHRPHPPVTLIKVDCQGADLHALRGLEDTIHVDRPLIVFEYEADASRWHGDSWQDYVDFFEAHRYQVTRIREDLGDYVARPR